MTDTKIQYNHKEAFCHMQYYGQKAKATVSLIIWNSRDGVTPFISYCKEFDLELQHVNWQRDRVDPGYKPKKGDLIWRDWTRAEAEEYGRKAYARFLEQFNEIRDMSDEELKAKYDWNPKSSLQALVDRGEQACIDGAVEDLIERKAPKLELVKEDWI